MTDPDIVKRLQADAIFFGTRQEPLLVDDAICREMAECWEIAADEVDAYALVCGTMPTYRIAGWCWSQELIMDTNVIDLGHGPGYGLTQDRLRPFALLASMLGFQTQQARRRVGT